MQSIKKEMEFMNMVSQLSSELHLGSLLQKIVAAITKMLEAERSTIFLNDDKTNTLYTIVGEGLGSSQIRFPNHMGIAGTVYKSGKISSTWSRPCCITNSWLFCWFQSKPTTFLKPVAYRIPSL